MSSLFSSTLFINTGNTRHPSHGDAYYRIYKRRLQMQYSNRKPQVILFLSIFHNDLHCSISMQFHVFPRQL